MGLKTDTTKTLKIDLDKFNKRSVLDTTVIRAVDLGKAMTSGYMKNLRLCVERGRKERSGDFFVVVLRKREKLVNKMVRSMFFHRLTCPTPNYEQVVYHYSRATCGLDEIWVIPDRETCFDMRSNIIEASKDAPELLKHVLDFNDGTLVRKMSELNGEEVHSLKLTEEKLKEFSKK